MTVAFTERTVRSLALPEQGQKDYFDEKLPGFGLRVSASGVRSWFIMYRHGGRVRRMTLSRCELLPDLDEARNQARLLLAAAKNGSDPATERQAQRQAQRTARQGEDDSFGALAGLYLEKHAKTKKRSWKIDDLAIKRDLGSWHHRRAKDITPTEIEAVLERIIARGAPVQANRTRAVISKVFSFGLKSPSARLRFGLVANPVQGTERPTSLRERDRVLNADEIRSLWKALDNEDPDTAALFKLYLLTAQRGGELRTIRREDLDLEAGWWTIPPERSKNKLPHRVPLSPSVLTIVREQLARHASPWLFPTNEGAARGYRSSIQRAAIRLRKAAALDFWAHDLRRTCASHLAGMGVPRFTIGRILNHAEPGITRVYDRHSYDPEKRDALDRWARRLHAIVTGESAPKVVELRRG